MAVLGVGPAWIRTCGSEKSYEPKLGADPRSCMP
jgi:hypothetical protein